MSEKEEIKHLIETGREIHDTSKAKVYEEMKKAMWTMVEYKEMQMMYSCALKEIQTKFEILNLEFKIKYKRNPISYVSTRLKRNESIAKKMLRKNIPITIENIENNICDIAGIRVVCSYIDDIYMLAEALLKQDDIRLVEICDYIKNPKPSGYRSLHLIVEIPIFLVDKKQLVKVEVQIRTIAMEFWASLEHQMKYKREKSIEQLEERLKQCAEEINKTDEEMMQLRKEIDDLSEDFDDDVELRERLKRLDTPLN